MVNNKKATIINHRDTELTETRNFSLIEMNNISAS